MKRTTRKEREQLTNEIWMRMGKPKPVASAKMIVILTSVVWAASFGVYLLGGPVLGAFTLGVGVIGGVIFQMEYPFGQLSVYSARKAAMYGPVTRGIYYDALKATFLNEAQAKLADTIVDGFNGDGITLMEISRSLGKHTS